MSAETRDHPYDGTFPITHPIPAGKRVLVHQIALARRPFIEGSARIVAPASKEVGLYVVRFEGERADQVRSILSGPFQSHSEACLATLHTHWLASFRHAQHLQALLRSDEGEL